MGELPGDVSLSLPITKIGLSVGVLSAGSSVGVGTPDEGEPSGVFVSFGEVGASVGPDGVIGIGDCVAGFDVAP